MEKDLKISNAKDSINQKELLYRKLTKNAKHTQEWKEYMKHRQKKTYVL